MIRLAGLCLLALLILAGINPVRHPIRALQGTDTATPSPTDSPDPETHANRTVFVIAMENQNWSAIKNSPSAPYINRQLLPIAGYTEQYFNPPRLHPSEPNYLWLEAGTNFGILNDADPPHNHNQSTEHLVPLLDQAGIALKTYQEGH